MKCLKSIVLISWWPMHVSVKEYEEESRRGLGVFFNPVFSFVWAKFIYVNHIYAKVMVTHNNTDKLCVHQQQCVCVV